MVEEKMKILYLMKVLLQETDKNHPLNARKLCEKVQEYYECTYDRKTIYTDIERLRAFGINIAQKKGSSFGYFVEKREFDLPELKLLVDAVQSSKFITREKSDDLIKKLESLTSREYAKQLQRQVFIYNRIKVGNDSIYSNVDRIHTAIHDDDQISFKYCEWTMEKELVPRKNGAEYIVSPWALTWDNENYYLVAYDGEARKIKHYRVDKMKDIRLLEQERLGKDEFRDFDLAAYSRKTFSMFGGQERNITLEGDNRLAGVMIDRFGTDFMMYSRGKDRFRARVAVSVSPQFFGWLAGLGKGMRIISPEDVRDEYRNYLQEILDQEQ